MSKVFVVDMNKQPLDPVHPGWARILLSSGKAVILKRYPFTIQLKVAVPAPQVQPLRIKIDPGSKTTGIALVNDASGEVIFAAELAHRGQTVKEALDDRRAARRGRRQRHTRYRPTGYHNRRKREGWLAPSLESRIGKVITWVKHLIANGSFTITTPSGTVTDIRYRYCICLQHADGYGYIHKKGGRGGDPSPRRRWVPAAHVLWHQSE